jgi:hypothetical protein
MARPKGYRLHGPTFQALAKAKHLDMVEVARQCDPPMKLTTLSGLVNDDHGASMATVRQVCSGLGLDDPSAVFPELSGRFSYIEKSARVPNLKAAS